MANRAKMIDGNRAYDVVRHACYAYLLSRSQDEQAAITYGKLHVASAQNTMSPTSHGRRGETITYSTEEKKGSYPYCDRGRICDAPLDGHDAKEASFHPRKVRRRGVAGRSRALGMIAKEGL